MAHCRRKLQPGNADWTVKGSLSWLPLRFARDPLLAFAVAVAAVQRACGLRRSGAAGKQRDGRGQ